MAPSLLLSSISACGDPLKDAQELKETRVLGVRFASESNDATPALGERVEVQVLLAGPKGPSGGRMAYAICSAVESARGVPLCVEDPFAEGKIDLDDEALIVDIPSTLKEGQRLAVLGTICLSGEPQLKDEPLDWSCTGDEESLNLSFDAWVESEHLRNKNPDLSELKVEVGGVEIPLDDIGASATCDESVPSIDLKKIHDVEIQLGKNAREEIGGSSHEFLQVSHFANIGLYERHFSFVEVDAETEINVEWEGPKKESAVKNYLVVRDGRGGTSWVSYSFCVR